MKKSRLFNHKMLKQLENVSTEVSESAFRMYLAALVLADDGGRLTKEELDKARDFVEHGHIGYLVLDDGAVRVWISDEA